MPESLDKKYRTTNKDFLIFCKECRRLISIFGLTHYKIWYEHKLLDGKAQIASNHDTDHTAVLRLSTQWVDEEPTPDKLRASALHEVLELLLAEFNVVAFSRFVRCEEQIVLVSHAIIRRIENALPFLKGD